MMAVMSPGSSKSLPVSKMNYFGVGAKMLRAMMKEKNVSSLEDMIALARDLGVRMIACEMSRDVMGIKESELAGGIECGGVATFLGRFAEIAHQPVYLKPVFTTRRAAALRAHRARSLQRDSSLRSE